MPPAPQIWLLLQPLVRPPVPPVCWPSRRHDHYTRQRAAGFSLQYPATGYCSARCFSANNRVNSGRQARTSSLLACLLVRLPASEWLPRRIRRRQLESGSSLVDRGIHTANTSCCQVKAPAPALHVKVSAFVIPPEQKALRMYRSLSFAAFVYVCVGCLAGWLLWRRQWQISFGAGATASRYTYTHIYIFNYISVLVLFVC